MLLTMISILGSFIAEIAGGVIAYQLTEGRGGVSSPTYVVPSRHVVVEHRHIVEYRPRRVASDEDELLGFLGILLVVIVIVVTIVGVLATFVAKYGSSIASLTEYISITVAALAGLMLLIELRQGNDRGESEKFWIILFIVIMCLAFYGMAWMLKRPLNPPEGWQDVRQAMQAIQIGAEGWTTQAFEIAWDNFQVTLFFALQTLGLIPQTIAMILTVYLELSLIGFLANSTEDFQVSWLVVWGIPILAFGASLFLGLGWPVVASLFS